MREPDMQREQRHVQVIRRALAWAKGVVPYLYLMTVAVAIAAPKQKATAASGVVTPTAGAPVLTLPAILPVDRVEAGMQGYGLTVFRGTEPERFNVRVVSVLKNFLPKQDIILVRVEDERVEHSGVAAGMSGSPIYLDGKLAGALAYAWTFAKEPMAGITPIEAMFADARRPVRERAPAGMRRVSFGHETGVGAQPMAAMPALGVSELRPVSLPLALSGFDPRVLAGAREVFAEAGLGLLPVAAAAGGAVDATMPVKLVPGGAVGVELVRGDMNAVATGTVTFTDDRTVLAFGHPMMGAGQVHLPMVGARIHTIMPSLASAFKIASPLGEVGTMVQDRRASIVGYLGARAERIPMTITVTPDGGEPVPFSVELARHERLTPLLVSMVASSALASAEPDPVDVVADVTTRIVLRGYAPVELREQMFSPAGFSIRELGNSHGIRVLSALLGNPFENVELDRLDVSARLIFRRDVVEVVGARVAELPVRAGRKARVLVTLRPFAANEYVESIEVDVPHRLAGKTVNLEISGGTAVKVFRPEPANLRELIDGLRMFYPASALVVSLSLPETGAALRGRLLPGLPPAALDTLIPMHETRRSQPQPLFERSIATGARVVTGKVELKLAIEDDPLGRGI